MPQRYFVRREAPHVARHVELLIEFFKGWAVSVNDPEPVLHWRELKNQGCSELTVIWLNRNRLLSHISGALAANKVNILLADIFSRADDVVIDIFRVCTTNFEPVTSKFTQRKIGELLRAGLRGEAAPYAELIDKADDDLKDWQDLAKSFPQRVYINNHDDPDHTLVEIQALDRLGLLRTIVSAISEHGYEITNARITTTRGAAIDTLHVVDRDGEKITGEVEITALLECVERSLGTAADENS
jgi:[protein-PII] uridylyltransferase